MKPYRSIFTLSLIIFAIIAVIITVGCSSTENKPAQSATAKSEAATPAPAKEPAFYTGQEALNRMMGLAIRWSPDAQPARVESVFTTEANGQNGKSAIWRGYFASPARHATRTIVCSGSRKPDAPPFGASTEGNEGAYNSEAANLAFMSILVKADTDKAFEVAELHGGDAILKKDAQQPITYVLLKDRKQNLPVWYVIYGTSEKDRKGIGVINANTGAFISAGK